jgi:dissimilatory sulfite reductase (desulfoviridin) alpha/beta subunit
VSDVMELQLHARTCAEEMECLSVCEDLWWDGQQHVWQTVQGGHFQHLWNLFVYWMKIKLTI